MNKCEICGSTLNLEMHHAVFRSQSKIMINMSVNHVCLCSYCHRYSKESPHHNKKRDLELKSQVQRKLEKLLCKEHYTPEGLQKALKLTLNQLKQIQKHCTYQDKGYSSREVIFYMMGCRFYESGVA